MTECFPLYPAVYGFAAEKEMGGFNVVQIAKEMCYGGQLETITLAIRIADSLNNSLESVGPTGRLFPDQPRLEYCRFGDYHRSAASQSLGDLVCSWV